MIRSARAPLSNGLEVGSEVNNIGGSRFMGQEKKIKILNGE